MSESARGEGGRVWVYGDSLKTYENPFIRDEKSQPRKFKCGETGKPWYFLEEMYPKYGNLVPRDVATREIFMICTKMGLGVDGENKVFLDLTHKDPNELTRKLGGILEIYEKFVGTDPRFEPMQIFPAVHYSMGGLWVDYNQMSNVPGCFVAGEADYEFHGANRLGANSLLSCVYSGMVAGPAIVSYMKNLAKKASDLPDSFFESEKNAVEARYKWATGLSGTENSFSLWKEMGDVMTKECTIVRYNKGLQDCDQKLMELRERLNKVDISDTSKTVNSTILFTLQFEDMLQLGRAVVHSALNRDESRGAHYKPDFPNRNDEQFLKTTMASFREDKPVISYADVDTSLITPRARQYASS
jgi:succinate dehydrogenase / fumarate reductase flavoprotein subunit